MAESSGDQLLGSSGDRAASGEPQRVPVNVYTTSGAVVVVAALPGVMADDVTVTLDEGRATIAASMRTAAPKDYLVHEWHYGPFERTVDLPDGYGGEAEASFNNGQLALRVARGDGEGGRRIVPVGAKP